MKAYWGSGGIAPQLHVYLTSGLLGGSGQLHAPAALAAEKETLVKLTEINFLKSQSFPNVIYSLSR
jgi:hypothetical protein